MLKLRHILPALMLLPCSLQAQDLKLAADSIRKSHNVPAIAYAIVTADSILEEGVSGVIKTGETNDNARVKLTDYFHLGSNTKAITGFVAAYLVEQGTISWDTKFFDLFPDWKKNSNPAYYQVTLAELLSHRAGIQPYTSGLEKQKLPKFSGSVPEQRKQFVQYVLKEKPVKNTGKSFSYSNAGYSVAALMLEKSSGKTWEALVEEVLGQKLHLGYYIGWPNKYDISQPWGHWDENDTLQALPPDVAYNLALIEPAGDISMPIDDYARFVQLNVQGVSGRDNFLKAETYSYLHTGFPDYSIGWANVKDTTNDISEHAGSAGTFYCYTIIDRKRKLGYIIIANSGTKQAEGAIPRMLTRMIRKYPGR